LRERTALEIGFRPLLDAAPDATVVVTPDGSVVAMNRRGDQLFGWSETEMVGQPLERLIPPRFQRVLEASSAGSDPSHATRDRGSRVSVFAQRRDGTEFPVEISRSPLSDDADALILVTLRDLTEWRRTQEILFREKEQATTALESIADAVMTTDQAGRIVYLNPMAERLTGWRTAEAVGLPAQTVLTFISDTTREPIEGTVARCLAEGRAVDLADGVLLLRRDGTEMNIMDSAAPIRDRNGVVTGVVMVFHDVSEKRRVSRRLSHEAAHDSLTSLVNRAEFDRRLARVLAHAHEGAAVDHALFYMDLDRFKLVNDSCGHEAGDEVLRRIAVLLGAQMRKRDTLARIGGDEFAVLLEDCSLGEAGEIAGKVLRAVEEFHFAWEGQQCTVGISIGVVPITASSGRVSAVLRAADAACYAAKEAGGNRVRIDRPQVNANPAPHTDTRSISRVSRALQDGKFHLFAQAIVPLVPDRAMRPRCEILLRLADDHGHPQPAASFLPQAERYHLMPAIDRWVVRRTIELLGTWREENPDCQLPLCSINLSNATLHDDTLIPTLRDHLAQFRLPPEALCFEVAESAALGNFAETVRFLSAIRDTGCGIALDDFGSGLNSLAYLKAMPVDFLKISGHYVRGVVDDPIYGTIVAAVNKVGRHMGIATVAGQVESEPVLSRLRSMGIGYAQGNVVSPPQPLADDDGTAFMQCVQLIA
jgi:diguanylate cyclase (GGDEF)-like protein/PAS domain S-box-containing protein